MTVKHIYDCPNCGNDYQEQRAANEQQFITVCTRCNAADFIEVSSEVISENVERMKPEEIVEENNGV
jgi:uncharacterized protein (DUF983 family)